MLQLVDLLFFNLFNASGDAINRVATNNNHSLIANCYLYGL